MILALALLLLVGTAEAQVIGGGVLPPGTRCDYFASPTGLAANSGTAPNAPIRIRDFWVKTTPLAGKTLCLLPGTYQGSDHVISPSTQAAPVGLSGTSSNPITIRALVEGSVLIDGQHARSPILLSGNSWFVLIGMNAKRGGPSGNEVVRVVNSSNNNVFQRIVAWDTIINTNSVVIGTHNSAGPNLFEDVAAFGTGRKVFSPSQGGNRITCRRCWFRAEGSINSGELGITAFYDSFDMLLENVLVTWSGESRPHTYRTGDNPANSLTTNWGSPAGFPGPGWVFGHDRVETTATDPDFCANARVYSGLAYLKATTEAGNQVRYYNNSDGTPRVNQGVFSASMANCLDYRHIFSIVDQSHTGASFWHAVQLGILNGAGQSGANPTQVTASNISSVRNNARPDNVSGGWVVTGKSQANCVTGVGACVSGVPSPWTATTTGANLCKRWQDGVVTSEPLWPWPMNARIKAATASAGAYNGPGCTTCLNANGTPYTFPARGATDVTADVETMLGPIPRECRKP